MNTIFFVFLPHKLPIILTLDFSKIRTSKRLGISLCFKETLILKEMFRKTTKYSIAYNLV